MGADTSVGPVAAGVSHALAGITDRRQFLDTMLDLLARLVPCTSIGWNALDKGTGTVRKRLEHAYDELGAHDRLLAVQRARELQLL